MNPRDRNTFFVVEKMPGIVFDDEKHARAEALRCAKEEPGRMFTVYAAIAGVLVQPPAPPPEPEWTRYIEVPL